MGECEIEVRDQRWLVITENWMNLFLTYSQLFAIIDYIRLLAISTVPHDEGGMCKGAEYEV